MLLRPEVMTIHLYGRCWYYNIIINESGGYDVVIISYRPGGGGGVGLVGKLRTHIFARWTYAINPYHMGRYERMRGDRNAIRGLYVLISCANILLYYKLGLCGSSAKNVLTYTWVYFMPMHTSFQTVYNSIVITNIITIIRYFIAIYESLTIREI